MKQLFLSLLLMCALTIGWAQSETHDFITYDTVLRFQPDPNNQYYFWLYTTRITRPRNLFTAGHPDTASRPALITMPGQGEMGTDTTKLRVYGPHYFMHNGWDGSVTLGNGKHYPIIITTIANTTFPTPEGNAMFLRYMIDHYHIKSNSVHLGGLSQGAFTWTEMIGYEASPGAETGMSMVTSLVALQGFTLVQNPTQPYDAWNRGKAAYGVWAKKYGGKFFGLEGTQDFRGVAVGSKAMQDSAPGSAHFTYENSAAGGSAGSHCCWNSMYDINQHNWQSFSPYGPLVALGTDTPSRGTYKIGSSIFEWMLRQGDTSMVGAAVQPGNYVNDVIVAEYKTWYIRQDSTIWASNNGSRNVVQYTIGGTRKAIMGAGGFNVFLVLDDQGYIWNSNIAQSLVTNRQDFDSAGLVFNNNVFIDAYANTRVSIRADGSIWYWGKDSYNMFYTGGATGASASGVLMQPLQLSPSGLVFKKVLLGGTMIVAVTTSGDVYTFYPGNRTPVKMTLPRPAIDIAVSHLDAAIAIVPDPVGTGSQTMGYPYVWGTRSSMWGQTGAFPTPSPLKGVWSLTVPIKELKMSRNTIHYIDSLGYLSGCGFNPMGEVGNGQEFVNKYDYPGFPGYGWDFQDGENPSGFPVKISSKTDWKHIQKNNWFSFYTCALDNNDSLYSWGRNKSLVLGNGYYNNQEQNSYDAMDVIVPTMVHPLNAIYQQYAFTAPTLDAGADQNITTSTTTLTGTGKAVDLTYTGTLFNGVPRVGYDFIGYKWTQASGPACTITNSTALSTGVSGMASGVYKFYLVATDNNTGTIRDSVIVTTNVSGVPPTVSAGSPQSITQPASGVTLTGTATPNGSGVTITSVTWSTTQAPAGATPVIASIHTTSTAVTALSQVGTYIFTLSATDSNNNTTSSNVTITVLAAPNPNCGCGIPLVNQTIKL